MCKYRVRYFHSKGALLVLVWTTLVSIALATMTRNNISEACYHQDAVAVFLNTRKWLLPLSIILGMLGAIFSGWLADAKWGNYRVVKYSIILLFVTSVCSSIVTLLPCSVYNVYTVAVIFCIGGGVLLIAAIAFIVTALQLGLDQMPDASSSSITSFIAWFGFSFYVGSWINTLVIYINETCFNNVIWQYQLTSLVSPIFMTVVLVLDSLLTKKWLIIEPISPQSFKTIYQVLKFAWKHKSPLNRSALTYWEEDIPSRMDLGKSRYGGPFTTEQVEDVKTILRLIPLCLTLWLLGSTMAFKSGVFKNIIIKDYSFKNGLLKLFTYNPWWCGMVWTVFFEFVIYPVVRNKLPSILKRIGIISFLVTISSVLTLILFYFHSNTIVFGKIAIALHSISQGVLLLLLHVNMLELVCAQAPYNMRGKFGGWIVFILLCTLATQIVIPPSLIVYGIGTGLSLLGFVVYCLLARWYKMRVRDEEYNTQRVVEEVYDRYLSQR